MPGLCILRGAHAGAAGCAGSGAVGQVKCRMPAPATFNSNAAAFFGGVKSALDLGVLSGDCRHLYRHRRAGAWFRLASWWLALSTVLVWAGPAQVILISALGTGAAPIEAAIAVSLSAIRLFPMVVALLPMLRGPGTRLRDLLLPTHFTSVSMWVESLRLLPAIAARAAHRLLQRAVGRLHGHGGERSASSAIISPPSCRRCSPARCCSSRRCRFWFRPRAMPA